MRPIDTDDVWQRMEELLDRGLGQINSLNGTSEGEADHDLQVAFKAIEYLAPPSWGAVEKTEISGRLVSTRPPMLIDRPVRAAIRQRLRQPDDKTPEIIETNGTISELDKQEATCKLRDDQGTTLYQLSFDEKLYEEVKDALDTGREVRIAARTIPSTSVAELLAVEFLS